MLRGRIEFGEAGLEVGREVRDSSGYLRMDRRLAGIDRGGEAGGSRAVETRCVRAVSSGDCTSCHRARYVVVPSSTGHLTDRLGPQRRLRLLRLRSALASSLPRLKIRHLRRMSRYLTATRSSRASRPSWSSQSCLRPNRRRRRANLRLPRLPTRPSRNQRKPRRILRRLLRPLYLRLAPRRRPFGCPASRRASCKVRKFSRSLSSSLRLPVILRRRRLRLHLIHPSQSPHQHRLQHRLRQHRLLRVPASLRNLPKPLRLLPHQPFRLLRLSLPLPSAGHACPHISSVARRLHCAYRHRRHPRPPARLRPNPQRHCRRLPPHQAPPRRSRRTPKSRLPSRVFRQRRRLQLLRRKPRQPAVSLPPFRRHPSSARQLVYLSHPPRPPQSRRPRPHPFLQPLRLGSPRPAVFHLRSSALRRLSLLRCVVRMRRRQRRDACRPAGRLRRAGRTAGL
ncbi:hypothetical protein AAT19DRAFT_16794 [Rhodotorula toruloides]|uniref:Uncharacterized protein n=1 Tax=Rhodotorula toruloides TaxID=5286 RepID=A0A2T0A4G5_RHOTO|nr:hypothetical protein AAT19DRAFT_16794 [Rhodotorula toruloides]